MKYRRIFDPPFLRLILVAIQVTGLFIVASTALAIMVVAGGLHGLGKRLIGWVHGQTQELEKKHPKH